MGLLLMKPARVLLSYTGPNRKKHRSLILEADGRHVLTDCLTSLGVIVGLGLTMLTGWLRFDPDRCDSCGPEHPLDGQQVDSPIHRWVDG